MADRVYNVLQIFSGAGGGCLGFQRAAAEYRGVSARFRTIGALDSDPGACEALERITGGRATVCDLFTRDQYRLFHGKEPPPDWREMGPADLLAACGNERPDVVFTSPPCKGFSGLLSGKKAAKPKYQALNELVTRALFLVLETWADNPPDLILLENVPRIQQRGRALLDLLNRTLRAYGYAVAETTHDCGELGGLGQTRKRFLLVARRIATCPAYLYEPVKHPLKSIGSIIESLPLPSSSDAGPMHQVPKLTEKTWIRLAMIRAGKDWKDLKERWAEGKWAIVPAEPVTHRSGKRFNNVFRLVRWDEPCPAVTGGAHPSSGALSVSDPRVEGAGWRNGVMGVQPDGEPATTVTGMARPSTGAFSVADPRLTSALTPTSVTLRVRAADKPSPTVTGTTSVWDSGGFAVACDVGAVRLGEHAGKMRVEDHARPAHTITGVADIQAGCLSVADPTLNIAPRNGMMGVQRWGAPGVTVTGSIDVQAGTAAVADPRPSDEGACESSPKILLSDDGCWHRPLTELELLMLQSFPTTGADGKPLALPGKSHAKWRMWIGNAVPPDTAQAIAEMMAVTLTVSRDFGGFHLGSGGFWVRDRGTLHWRETRAEITNERMEWMQ